MFNIVNKKSICLRLIFKSNSRKVIFLYRLFVAKLLVKLGAKHASFTLTKKKKVLTLLKSPHVNKKAKEQFGLNQYKLVFYVEENISRSILKLIFLNKPSSLFFRLEEIF